MPYNTKPVGVAYSDPELDSLSVTGATSLTGAVTASGGVTGAITGTQTGNWIMPSATVAATGTNQATAAAIVTGFTLVSAADGTVGVLLPAAVAGSICIVKNNAAAVLKVWPAGTNTINAIAASTNIAMASLTSAVFVAYNTTAWYTVPLLPS